MHRADAVEVADLLQTPPSQPIKPNDAQAFALLRALDNLRWAGDLDGKRELLRLRDCLVSKYGVTVSYELQLKVDDEVVRWTSYSGTFEVGDRLRTTSGLGWRVTHRVSRGPETDLLICELDPKEPNEG